MVLLRKIEARRYLRDRGEEFRVAKSKVFREEIIERLPVDRFRHFFRMNPAPGDGNERKSGRYGG